MDRKRSTTIKDNDGPPSKKARCDQLGEHFNSFWLETTYHLVELGWPTAVTDIVNAFCGTCFLSTWQVPSDTGKIEIPGMAKDWVKIDWGDGHQEVVSQTGQSTVRSFSHQYSQELYGQQVNIRIDGTVIDFSFYSLSKAACQTIISIQEWGSIVLEPFHGYHFSHCIRLVSLPGDSCCALDGVKIMCAMFNQATSFQSDISQWDVSSVTDMGDMFCFATSFNQDLSGWDVSSVTDMESMFENAISFTSDLSKWDVSSVTNMESMFEHATSFKSDLSGWNVSSVTNMELMFKHATSFKSDLSGWDLSSLENAIGPFGEDVYCLK